MLKDIFDKLRKKKFNELKNLADGYSLKSKDKSENYVYFFMPGETDLEAKFRIAFIVYESSKMGMGRFFLPSVYKKDVSAINFDDDEWTLAKHSKVIVDNREMFLISLQNMVDCHIFATARRSHWTLPVFHLYHQYFYMNKKEREAFFSLPFSRKKVLASRALEFMSPEGPKICKNQFLQLAGDLKSSISMVAEISDVLADLTIQEGQVYLFTR